MPLSASERQRRRRERVRDGRYCVVVEVDGAIVEDALIARRFLRPDDAHDPVAIAAALREAVAQMIVPPVGPYDTVTRDAVDFKTVA